MLGVRNFMVPFITCTAGVELSRVIHHFEVIGETIKLHSLKEVHVIFTKSLALLRNLYYSYLFF